jgi:hypothetical protein
MTTLEKMKYTSSSAYLLQEKKKNVTILQHRLLQILFQVLKVNDEKYIY